MPEEICDGGAFSPAGGPLGGVLEELDSSLVSPAIVLMLCNGTFEFERYQYAKPGESCAAVENSSPANQAEVELEVKFNLSLNS